MKMDLKQPCPECPFRNDIPSYLKKERVAEILDTLLIQDGVFSCHKTVDYSSDDEPTCDPDQQHCAGALILLEKLEKPNQWMRIAERIGCYDRLQLEMNSPVFDSMEEMIDAQE